MYEKIIVMIGVSNMDDINKNNLEKNETSPSYLIKKANSLITEGKFDEAIEAADLAVKLSNYQLKYFILKIKILYDSHKYDGCSKLIESKLEDFYKIMDAEEFINILTMLSKSYALSVGGTDLNSEISVKEILQVKNIPWVLGEEIKIEDAKDCEYFAVKAEKFKTEKAFLKTLQYCNLAIKYGKTDASVYFTKAIALFSMEDYSNAILNYEKVIELDKTNWKALNNKALALMKLKRYEEAIKIFKYALEISAENKEVLYNMAEVYKIKDDYIKVLEIHDHLIDFYAKDADVYYKKALLLDDVELYKEATKKYKIARKLDLAMVAPINTARDDASKSELKRKRINRVLTLIVIIIAIFIGNYIRTWNEAKTDNHINVKTSTGNKIAGNSNASDANVKKFDTTYIIKDGSNRQLTQADMNKFTSDDLLLARNEIYARHGQTFADERLQKYFNNKTWYKPDKTNGITLSAIEQSNIDLIEQAEAVKLASKRYRITNYMLPSVLTYTSVEKVNIQDLTALNPWELIIARNEIYARHGMPFQLIELKNYFAAKSWYKIDPAFNDASISEVENFNVGLIQNEENTRIDSLLNPSTRTINPNNKY